jgi:hypothetical protein
MRRARLPLRALLAPAPALLLCLSAAAQEPAPPPAARWDDGHMRSNFAHYLDVPVAPAVVIGTDRYDQIAHGTVPTPATGVREQTFSISQHPWRPAAPTASTSDSTDPLAATFSGSTVVRAQRSAGVRSTAPSPGSAYHR